MDTPLFSDNWYRVKFLTPALRPHALLHRQEFRGAIWYVLEDSSSSRFHRFNSAAYQFIGLMDGRRSVHAIWEIVNTLLGDDAPRQDEIIQLLGQLHQVDALQTNISPDVQEIFRRSEEHELQQRWRPLKTPLGLRVPLVDPDRFLDRTLPFVRFVYSKGFAVVWLLIVSLAMLLAGANWGVLVDTVRLQALAPDNLLLLLLVYPLVKLIHELGHAYAAKLYGGEVHEIGAMFLVFIPVPYVDASAATTFADRGMRMLVSAMGMLAEMWLAALALFLWLSVEPGWVSRICLNIMLIGGVSTVLFNGNPLLRFDGYYLLADAIGIPNLAQRSNNYLAYLVQSRLFGMQNARSPVTAPGEAPWFVIYGIASFCYRLLLLTVICFFLVKELFLLGVLLALWAIYNQLCLPMLKQLRFLVNDPRLRNRRARAIVVCALGVGCMASVVALLPVSSLTRFEGVIWPPDDTHLVAGTEGFVDVVLQPAGAVVTRGQPLIRLSNLQHRGDMAVKLAQMDELTARFRQARVADRVKTQLIQEEISGLQSEIDLLRRKIDSLVVRSPIDGMFVSANSEDLPGQDVRQGDVLGYVVNQDRALARVMVTQQDQDRMSRRIEAIELWLAGSPERVLRGELRRTVPQATNRLPSKVLSVAGGGRFALDPEDASELVTLERLFEYEISMPVPADEAMIGSRVYVRFDHGSETLWTQLSRRLRQLFLSRLNA
ncbi:MAG: HlyD family efflux transporter periplasmic adaptor subunit [Congregibacter sp.]